MATNIIKQTKPATNGVPRTASNIVTEYDLMDLPAPVQRYLSYTGVVGKPWIDTAHVKYVGRFRTGEDKPWMSVRADQVYTINPPGFLWHARFKLAGLPLMMGTDVFKEGHSHMHGKLAGLLTVVDGHGDEVDQGTAVRYLQEMTWFPIAYLGKNITWQAVDDHAADVTLHVNGNSFTARMYFDDTGRMLSFIAQRYGEFNGRYEIRKWAAPMTEYGEFCGLNLPIAGLGIWQLPSGDFPYVDIRVHQIEYNQPIEGFQEIP